MADAGAGRDAHGQTSESRSKVGRRSFLAASAGSTIAALSGCVRLLGGGGSNGGEEEVHVVTGETNEAAKEWFDQMASDFEEETGTTVTMDYTSLSPTERISTLIQTGNTPELATLDTGQAAQLATRDQLESVEDLIGTFEQEYNGSIPENVRLAIDGDDYTVPLWTNPTQVWYWEDVYQEYNLESSAGLTWDEYLEIAQEINSDDMFGTVVPSASSELSSFTFWNFLKSNGGNVATRQDGEVQIALDQGENKQKAIETAEFLNELHQYSPEAGDFEWGDILQSYVSRNSAHCIYGPRAKLQVINNTPDQTQNVRPHFPVHNGTESFINNGGGWVLMQDAEYKEEARQFIEFTARENRVIDFLTSVGPVHNFPTMTSIVEMDAYREDDFIAGNFSERDLEVVRESFEKGVSWGGETDPYNEYGPSLFTSQHLGTLLYEMNINGVAPEQAVNSAADNLRDTLQSLKE
ncbi:extracellular solute-binding protein [Halostella sp. JP-L12]|uniref:ABC transporter substrate-binding protein n=1 Tax=Halostella TaxID=1843185 RepID=UPI000EF7884C|nr:MULTISPECIES: extracellular solute-binding protein [Halostella]NHN49356.1 extracellular solute-binding protein [Halostella sp. JP-L12]